jgi:L-fucose mutarotase
MLIGIPSILGPELLFTLRAMGHGDEIALVDGNYPAHEHARRLIRADGHGLIPLLDAILQVTPVDDFATHSLFRATVGDNPDTLDPVHDEIVAVCQRWAPDHAVIPLLGSAFYDRVKAAHTIVATSEPRLYGNVIIRKGVVYPRV